MIPASKTVKNRFTVLVLTTLAIFGSFRAQLSQASLPINSPPADGVYVNADGAPILPLIKNAATRLDIEIYTMNDPTVRALIREALARQVRVRILKDPSPLGEKCDLFNPASSTDHSPECLDQQKLVADVRMAGGIFEPFDKKALCPNGGGKAGTLCFEHGKIALADLLSGKGSSSRAALISTGNFDSSNLCTNGTKRCDRDFSLVVSDPTIYDTLLTFFEADLKAISYDVKSQIPQSLQGKLTVSPASLEPMIAFIQSAKNSIEVEAQYLKEPNLNAALKERAQSGVKVSLTVASACSFGKPSVYEQKQIQSIYSEFDQLGISSRFFNASNRINGVAGYMHAKAMVVDSARAWVGSENGSVTSFGQNREYGLIFEESDSVARVLATALADHDSAQSESWQESLNCAKDYGATADLTDFFRL